MPDGPRISAILDELAADIRSERVSLRELVAALGGRALALLILLFALPNAVGLGAIPGVSTVFGVPQIFVAVQMALRPHRLWLPAWLLNRSIGRNEFVTMVERARSSLLRIERVLRARWMILPQAAAERLCGIILTLLAITVSLPIPLANQLPAIASALIAIGLLAADGLVVVAGLVAAAIALAVATAVVLGGAEALLLAWRHLIGG